MSFLAAVPALTHERFALSFAILAFALTVFSLGVLAAFATPRLAPFTFASLEKVEVGLRILHIGNQLLI
jgi:hypothetical protein